MNDLSNLIRKTVLLLRKEKLSEPEIAQRLKISGEEVSNVIGKIYDKGYDIRTQFIKTGRKSEVPFHYIKTLEGLDTSYVLSPSSRERNSITHLVISDLHGGSTGFDDVGLEHVLGEAYEQGVRHAIIPGDLVDGKDMFRGQMNVLKFWRYEDQVESVARILRKFPYDYMAIDGNHDYSWEREGMISPVKHLSETIPNFRYLRGVVANLVIEGVLLRVMHGDKGAYQISYHPQVYLRNYLRAGVLHNIDGKFYTTRIMYAGHWHAKLAMYEFGVDVLLPGSLQRVVSEKFIRQGLTGPRGGFINKFTTYRGKVLDMEYKWIDAGTD